MYKRQYFPAGVYRFVATMDDGMRVWIDGLPIIDAWGASAEHTVSKDVPLAEGWHNIRVDYQERGGMAVARFNWSPVSGGKDVYKRQDSDNVVGVGRHERAAVVTESGGVLDDLLDFEVAQVDDGHAGVGLVVDEQKVTIVVTVGLAQRRVMGVGPGERLTIDGLTTLSLIHI